MAPESSTASTDRHATALLPVPFWILVVGFTLCRSGCVVVPFLSLYLVRHQHVSAADAAQITAAFGGGWLIGPVVAGWCADRIGRRHTLLLTLSAVAATYLTLPHLETMPALSTAACAVGLLFDGPRPAVFALVADLVPPGDRSRGYARIYWASNFGAGVAGGLGIMLADHHITALFYVAAASNLAFAATVLICRIGTGPHEQPHRGPTVGRRGYSALLRDGPFLALNGLSLLYLCVYQQVLFGLPVAMNHDGLSPSAVGIISLINAIGVVAFQPLLQPWIGTRAPLVVSAAGAGILGVGMGGNLAAQQSLLGYGIAAAVWTLGEVLFFSTVMTVVERLAPIDARGRYAGVWASMMGLSALIAPLISAAALHTGGPALIWTASLILGTLAAAGLLTLNRHITETSRTRHPADPASVHV
ncbi:MFS transporter [Streptomyces sp. NPDC047082]|uniref:MFS transporter n=1 Tax=Streptomyces sp. NPDC047082 TaxID=3155259 RepID=UPI0033D6E806